MQLLYNSEAFTVLQISVSDAEVEGAPLRGGFEIVDKSSRKGIYIEGALAEGFQRGVPVSYTHLAARAVAETAAWAGAAAGAFIVVLPLALRPTRSIETDCTTRRRAPGSSPDEQGRFLRSGCF